MRAQKFGLPELDRIRRARKRYESVRPVQSSPNIPKVAQRSLVFGIGQEPATPHELLAKGVDETMQGGPKKPLQEIPFAGRSANPKLWRARNIETGPELGPPAFLTIRRDQLPSPKRTKRTRGIVGHVVADKRATVRMANASNIVPKCRRVDHTDKIGML
jgi:hypothetical protein